MIEAIGGTRYPDRGIVSQALAARTMMGNAMERDTLRECLDYLHVKGAVVIRNNSGRRGGVSYGQKGSSDILACLRGGKFLAVEVKRHKYGKATAEQLQFIDDIKSRGGIAVIVHTVAELSDALAKEGY